MHKNFFNRSSICNKLKELRGKKSQLEVAADLDISLSSLSAYENGDRIPRDEIKVRIANYYGVTVQELFFEE